MKNRKEPDNYQIPDISGVLSKRGRLKNFSREDLAAAIRGLGEPEFRTRQILKWVYQKRIDDFRNMNNIRASLRERLDERFTLEKMACRAAVRSAGGDAVKFVFQLLDSDDCVECVLLYDGKRRTACLSSQLGCGFGCAFCATATMGFVRNCTQDEILGQLVGINDYLFEKNDKPVTHVVFMGMGEALSNFTAFRASCEFITHQDCFGLALRRITVSTCGVVSSIERLIRDGPRVGLAISLNTFSDELRSRLMPVNRRYPIREVIAAGGKYVRETGCQLTFEYVVVEGENDTPEAVRRLVSMLKPVPCKVNCIPLNANPQNHGKQPSLEHVQRFADALYRKGLTVTVRKSRGDDIGGACGQLCLEMRQKGTD